VRRLALVCVVLCCSILSCFWTGPISAQGEPTLRFTGGDAAKTVKLKRDPRGSSVSGTLVVTVVNSTPASGALAFEFETAGDETSIMTDPRAPEIAARRPRKVDVTFRIAPGEDGKAELNGTLTSAFVHEQGVGPAIAEVKGSAPASPAFVTDSVDFTVVDWWGPLRWVDGRDESPEVSGDIEVSLRNAQGLNEDPAASTRLAGGGHEITLVLHRPLGSRNTLSLGRVDAEDVEYAGEYKGKLSLDPGAAGASALSATVKVTDAPYWPIAAVVLGAGLSWFLKVFLFQRVLGRRRLRESLQDAIEKYDAVLEKAPEGVTNLAASVGDPGAPGRYDCDAKALEFAQAYCAAEHAKGKDALEAARKKAKAMVAVIDRWTGLVAALQGLADVTKELPPREELHPRRPDPSRIHQDSEALLYGPVDVHSEETVTAYEEVVDSQTAVVTYFIAAWTARKELKELLKEKQGGAHDDARRALRECDPPEIYDDAKPPAERTTEEADSLLTQLDECVRKLRWHCHNLAGAPRERHARRGVAAEAVAGTAGPFGVMIAELASTDGLDIRAVKRRVSSTKADRRPSKGRSVPSARQLATGTRFGEGLVLAVIAALSLVFYFAANFAGQAFGTGPQYLAAVGVGFAGKFAADWLPSSGDADAASEDD
jgi:hypothetical protein